MENFNKNWLAILLIVIVFFILGFLVGRVTGNHHGMGKKVFKERTLKQNGDNDEISADGDEDKVTVTIDTLKNDGKNIEVKIEKKIKN